MMGFLVEIQGDNGTFKHFLFFKQLREVKAAARAAWGRPEEGPAECFINPIKQVDGEDLTDNLHLANEACDS